MYLPEEANFGPGEAVAIVGAALRFPGASDPSAFHEITVAGRRMFRELIYQGDTGGPALQANHAPGKHDQPPAGRAVPADRIGVFIADIPEPGTSAVHEWVSWHVDMLAAGDALPPAVRTRAVAADPGPVGGREHPGHRRSSRRAAVWSRSRRAAPRTRPDPPPWPTPEAAAVRERRPCG